MKHITLLAAALLAAACTVKAPAPYGPCPTPAQVEWQRMETNLFIHFGPNTFSGKEWGDGTEPEDIFNPTDMDCRQWAQVARDAGFKGVILTAKHHDGFCLWPNPVSRHTVRQSAWKNGEGDVLKDLSEACAEYGLGLGIYISPWDRFDPHYGTPEYNQVFEETLRSALGGYGPVFEQWFDGACGEGPNGKRQEYDWPLYYKTVFDLQPDAIVFSDVGPGCRWVGNERGVAGRTSWSTYETANFVPGIDSPKREAKNEGIRGGSLWVPSESDVSIRPGWFWRESENDQVKSLQELLGIYYTSVGRNSLLLAERSSRHPRPYPRGRLGPSARMAPGPWTGSSPSTWPRAERWRRPPVAEGPSRRAPFWTRTTTATGPFRTTCSPPASPLRSPRSAPSTASCCRNTSLWASGWPLSKWRCSQRRGVGKGGAGNHHRLQAHPPHSHRNRRRRADPHHRGRCLPRPEPPGPVYG